MPGAWYSTAGGGQVTIAATILAGNTNTANASNDDVNGNVSSQGYNLIQTVGSLTPTSTDLVGVDPQLTALSDNGGFAPTHALNTGSAAINMGLSTSSAYDGSGLSINELPDIGALEFRDPGSVVFYSDGTDSIFRLDGSGQHRQEIISGVGELVDIAVDAVGQRIYWLEAVSLELKSARLDGSDVQTHMTLTETYAAMALNAQTGTVYVTELGSYLHSIVAYDIATGSELNRGYVTDPAVDLVFDHGIDKLIRIDNGPLTHSVDTFEPDLGAREELASFTSGELPSAMTLSDDGDYFWVDPGNDLLGQVDVSDSYAINSVPVGFGGEPTGIAYDSIGDRLLVSTGSSGQIVSSDTAMGSLSVFATGLGSATWLEVMSADALADLNLEANTVIDLAEDGVVVLDTSMLSASDPTSTADQIVFSVDAAFTQAEFQIANVAVASFTQQDLLDGSVQIVHDGSDSGPGVATWRDSATLTIASGSTDRVPVTVTLAIAAVDDPPTLSLTQNPVVVENGTLVLTESMLIASDADTVDASLVFDVTGTTSGTIQIDGIDTTRFSAQALAEGRVSFVHDGAEPVAGADLTVTLSDGTTTVSAQTLTFAVAAVDDAPTLSLTQNPAITEGAALTLTGAMLTASDSDTAATSLVFDVTGTTSGDVQLDGASTTSFTAQQLADGRVTFLHDGSEPAAGADLTVTLGDGTTTLLAQTLNLAVTNSDDAPTLSLTQNPAIAEGASLTLSSAMLTASDVDTPDTALVFDVTGTTSGEVQLDGVTTAHLLPRTSRMVALRSCTTVRNLPMLIAVARLRRCCTTVGTCGSDGNPDNDGDDTSDTAGANRSGAVNSHGVRSPRTCRRCTGSCRLTLTQNPGITEGCCADTDQRDTQCQRCRYGGHRAGVHGDRHDVGCRSTRWRGYYQFHRAEHCGRACELRARRFGTGGWCRLDRHPQRWHHDAAAHRRSTWLSRIPTMPRR